MTMTIQTTTIAATRYPYQAEQIAANLTRDLPDYTTQVQGCMLMTEADAAQVRGAAGECGVRPDSVRTWTVDEDAIAALRTEAGEAGDLAQVALCDRALTGDAEALVECTALIEHARAGLVDARRRAQRAEPASSSNSPARPGCAAPSR
jgi:hypothetical protein